MTESLCTFWCCRRLSCLLKNLSQEGKPHLNAIVIICQQMSGNNIKQDAHVSRAYVSTVCVV